MFAIFFFALLLGQRAEQENSNSLFQQLVSDGLTIEGTRVARLPQPTIPDGLTADQQATALRALCESDRLLEGLMRRSMVAPHILRMQQLPAGDTNTPLRAVDVWFVTYGRLESIADKQFLESLLQSADTEVDGVEISTDELKQRGIVLGEREDFGHGKLLLVTRVALDVTGHSIWSQNDESITLAAKVDPRFTGDPTYPNRWTPVRREEVIQLDHAPYSGAGFYLKITRLAQPADALLVEFHMVYAEPTEWFDGANLLGSKMPLIVQDQVRAARREIVRAAGRRP